MRYMCKYTQNTRMRITRIQFYDVPLKPNLPSLFCVKEEKESEKEEEKLKKKKRRKKTDRSYSMFCMST